MNKTDILTRVTEASALVSEERYAAAIEALSKLADGLKADIRLDSAKSSGNLDATKAALRVLKNAANYSREGIKYPWIDGKDRQCFMDGFRAYRLKEALKLPPRPENAGEPIDLDKIMDTGTYSDECLTLPTIGELKASIQTQRAEWRATGKGKSVLRKPFSALWKFGDGQPAVDAEYLLDTLAIMGEGVEAHYSLTNEGKPNCVGPIQFTSERGDAILLPVRVFSDADQPKAPEKPKDPDIEDKLASLNERLAKERKSLDDAVRHMENFALSCKRCATMYPDTWSISPEDFADYANWANYADETRKKIADYERRIAELKAA